MFEPELTGLIGLPEHNVLLIAGRRDLEAIPSKFLPPLDDLQEPILVNNTDRAIISYAVFWVPVINQPICPGAGAPPLVPPRSELVIRQTTGVVGPNGRLLKPTAVILDSVVFDDGELVGPDVMNSFDNFSRRNQAEQEIHQLLLDSGWDAIEAAANKNRRDPDVQDPAYVMQQRTLAEELLRIRDAPLGGEEMAIRRAKLSAKYPKIWRKK